MIPLPSTCVSNEQGALSCTACRIENKISLRSVAGMACINVKVTQTQVSEPVFEVSISGVWPDNLFWLLLYLTGALLYLEIFHCNTSSIHCNHGVAIQLDWFLQGLRPIFMHQCDDSINKDVSRSCWGTGHNKYEKVLMG